MDNTCIPFVLINDRKMIDAKHVHKLLECKYDFKHWIKDVISSFNFKDGIDYISYRYDNNGEQIIDNNSHVFRHDYYLFPKSILCIIYMKCDRSLFKDFIYDIFDCCNIKNDDRVLDIIHRSILPVQIAVPANSTVSTVGADTCCPVTGVNVVNPINVAVTGAAMVNGTERLLYFNKVRGVLRLMDCCVPTTTAQASEVKAGK